MTVYGFKVCKLIGSTNKSLKGAYFSGLGIGAEFF